VGWFVVLVRISIPFVTILFSSSHHIRLSFSDCLTFRLFCSLLLKILEYREREREKGKRSYLLENINKVWIDQVQEIFLISLEREKKKSFNIQVKKKWIHRHRRHHRRRRSTTSPHSSRQRLCRIYCRRKEKSKTEAASDRAGDGCRRSTTSRLRSTSHDHLALSDVSSGTSSSSTGKLESPSPWCPSHFLSLSLSLPKHLQVS